MSCDLGALPLAGRLENWGNTSRGAFDPVDAARVTKAWQTLHPRHREMLRMVYAHVLLRLKRHPDVNRLQACG